MRFYLSSPDNRVQWEAVRGCPVLLSFALAGGKKWQSVDRYQAVASRVLIDSGAYSEMRSGRAVDLAAYADWAERWRGRADAVAGLDDIRGDWRRSLRNYAAMPAGLGFPTIHDTDPPELLADLIPIARERGGWLGCGLAPPRQGKEAFVRWVADRVPADIHLHGWALGLYADVPRLDSIDSTNWLLDLQKLQTCPLTAHLTDGEMLAVIVKRYRRMARRCRHTESTTPDLFSGVAEPRT